MMTIAAFLILVCKRFDL